MPDPTPRASSPPHPDALDKVLEILAHLEAQIAATREEGHARHETNKRVHAELRDALARLGRVVEEHGHTLLTDGNRLNEALERLASHERIMSALLEQSSAHASLLAKHTTDLSELRDAITAVKEAVREAKQAMSDLATAQQAFQDAVTRHVDGATKGLTTEIEGVKRGNEQLTKNTEQLAKNDVEQNRQLGLILDALGVTHVKADGDKHPPKPRLEQLERVGRIAILSSAGSIVILVLKLMIELLTKH